MLKGNIFLTGGSGTLGTAIVRRARAENWPCTFTIYSRDPLKQIAMRRLYPNERYIIGDIGDYDTLYRAMVGHETVIHAAAMKHITIAEENKLDCIATNVLGTQNVAMAAMMAGVKRAVAISTDKAAYSINTYGATKKLTESIFQDFNNSPTTFHLCRYGNVIGSNGSVVQVWNRQLAEGIKPTITHPDMTRFWMTEDEAVNTVLMAFKCAPGTIAVPLAPSLDMGTFARYILGDVELESIGLREGEKMHECLITEEEMRHSAMITGGYALIGKYPTQTTLGAYTSDTARRLTADELNAMLGVQ